jgi:DNA polymerase III delta prime subunit
MTALRCPNCGKEMKQVGEYWVCGNHRPLVSVPIESFSTPSVHPFSDLCAVLPTPIAFVLDEFSREGNAFVALWRMVDAAEIITRFFAITVLSDILRQKGEFPEPVQDALTEKLERPTFGAWKELLAIAIDNLPEERGQTHRFVSELLSFVRDKWLPALGSGEDKPEEKLIALRNLIAHSARLPEEQAQELLNARRQRFESLVKDLAFLANYALIACPKEGQIVWLKGLPDADGSFPEYDRPLSFVPELGRIYLVRDGEGLDLFPLHAFTDILQWREERYDFESLGEVAPQIYFRLSERGFLECIPFSHRAVFSYLGEDAYQCFRDIFKLEGWREQRRRKAEAQGIQKLWDEQVRELTEVFVGREEHIKQVKDAIKRTSKGVLWISGKPGVGKSALMAKLMRDYIGQTQHYIVIPYFFRYGQAGCSTMDFLATALKRLQAELKRTIEPAPHLPDRQKQLVEALEEVVSKTSKKVLFLVDGLDEIYRQEREFLNVPFMTIRERIVWVCAGRSEGDLEEALRSRGAEWGFPEGLPPLDEQATRAMLTEHLGRLKYALFERDEGERNRFVETVTRKSEGLPLYVRMVIEDLKAGRLTVWDEEKLPEGLVDYYERLLERLRVSDVGTVLTPLFCLLAWAKEPITEGTMKVLLQTHHLAGTPRWGELFRRAFEHGHLMLQQRPTPENEAGWTIYHHSFRQHLLESRTVIDNREWAQERWLKVCEDWKGLASQEPSLHRYILRHYPKHLHEAGRHEDFFALLHGSFLERKTELIGIGEAHADCGMAAQIAAEVGDDINLLRMIEKASGLEKGVARGWQSGQFVLSLLQDDVKLILSRASILAAEMLPWSAFLAAERVFDLGETDLALELLRQVVQREWPKYQPPTHAYGMAEGSAWDFLLGKEEEFILFVAKVATADVSLGLELIGRLFADRPGVLPNPKTAWREVIRILKTQELSPTFYRNLFEATNDWFKGSPIFGTRTLVMELFDILPRTLPSEDPTWIANAVLSCVQLRFGASESSQQGFFWACADVLDAILKLHRECSESHPLRSVLLETAQTVASSLPTVETPSEGDRTNRSMIWARLACCLQTCGNDRWREFADAALVACEKDGALVDANLIAVRQALSLLHNLEDPEIVQRVQEITETLGSRLQESINMQQEPLDKGDSDSTSLRVQLLKQFIEEHDPYRRGRIALEVYRRGLASVAELTTALSSVVRGSTDDELLRFEDALAEALIQILVDCGEPWAMEDIRRLDEGRSPKRREEVAINLTSMEARLWAAFVRNGHTNHLRSMLEARSEEALKGGDLNKLLNCCGGAILFDPDLADKFYRRMPNDLNSLDRGLAVVMLVNWLAQTQPNRLNDLGVRWLTDMPLLEHPSHLNDVAEYEIGMCRLWGKHDVFRSRLIGVIQRISLALLGTTIPQSKDERKELWEMVGYMLDAVGQIQTRSSDGSEAVVSQIIDRLRSLLQDLDSDEKNTAISSLLKQIRSTHQKGPVSRFVSQQFDHLSERGTFIGRDLQLELGLELAICLKNAEPAWAERRAQEAIAHWKDLLAEEKPAKETIERAARVLVDSLVSAFRGFRNAREFFLWELTEDLVKWAVKQEDARKVLLFLQEQIEQAKDRDSRSLLLAQVASGWLHLRDFTKVSALLEVVDFTSLKRASFYDKLLATPSSETPDELLGTLKSLLIKLLLCTPASEETFVDVLATWFNFRLRSIADRQARIQFIKRMLEAHAQWREVNPNVAKS